MYIAMNRFKIGPGKEEVFEELWRSRDSQLNDVPGFASHTTWDSKEAFVLWTESEAFRQAHAKARAPEGTYLGPPVFEGFEVVI